MLTKLSFKTITVLKLTETRKQQILNELKFSATKSSGPGGQNVNKVNTRVELRFNLEESDVFSNAEKRTIIFKLANRINSDGEIFMASSVERSQWRNKERVSERFFELIEKALTPQKKRIKTKRTQASRIKRLEGKKQLAQKKKNRRKPEL